MDKKSPGRISELPEEVVDKILSLLPIRDTARTSVLSTKWRNKWKSVSSLVFDHDQHEGDKSYHHLPGKLLRDVDWALLVHSGPIRKFELSCGSSLPVHCIDRWALFLSAHPIEELVIDVPNADPRWKMPNSWQRLTRLCISGCLLSPLPAASDGFRNLKSLYLRNTKLTSATLQSLVYSSTTLELLDLENIDRTPTPIRIAVPTLKSFRFRGPSCSEIWLQHSPTLEEYSLNSASFHDPNFAANCMSSLPDLTVLLPRVRILTIRGLFFEHLASSHVVPRELPVPFIHLRCLSVDVCFTCTTHTRALTSLLRSAPSLKELFIQCWPTEHRDTNGQEWSVEGWDRPFACLRKVQVTEFRASQEETRFIEFMLSASPVLDTVTMELGGNQGLSNRVFEILVELLGLERASPRAKINIPKPSPPPAHHNKDPFEQFEVSMLYGPLNLDFELYQ